MKKPVSKREQFGYIYIYALARGPKIQSSKYAYFKVGRSTDPLKRMYRISQSCKYEPAIIDVMPTLRSGYRCPASHRVERLIHLELDARFSRAKFQCHECHTEHREWFRIKRPEICTGVYMGDDPLFAQLIRPVILRWIQYGVAASPATHSDQES